ncbi:MAG: glycosyltransferase [Planctomycetota bacterium]|jgi:glycosyltransferase involved in cell wall biosynthesis
MAARVLHVVGSLDRGGVETWLMHVLRRIDRDRVAFDFLLESAEPGAFDAEAEALGARIIRCPKPRGPFRDTRAFVRVLREHGPYAAVHAHSYHRLGAALTAAARCGLALRIAHAHNDVRVQRRAAALHARLQLVAGERAVGRHATHGLACSALAAAALYGDDWKRDPRWRVMPYQIDLGAFDTPPQHTASRSALGIPAGAKVVAHVGRFSTQKNHSHIVSVFARLAEADPHVHLLLIGTGPEEPATKELVAERGADVADRTHFLGARDDVPALLTHVADAFLFPSRFEGLGLALVEAQAAGLPCIVSDAIPPEAIVVPPLVQRIALSAPIGEWANALQSAIARTPAVSAADALEAVRASDYDVARGCERLLRLYGV